ncbi:MAG: hypothetical protein NTZ17_06910 [Phycisphaerae bacterium]|nr:hypothetical protein [Phycisphaerae bacterium]
MRTLLLTLTTCLLVLPAQAKYSGGSGTLQDPYQIHAVADWQTLMSATADWNKYFVLTADLDFGGGSLSPVGTSISQPFTGVFDGNDHIISNALMQRPTGNCIGLFGYLSLHADANGQVRNLGAMNITIAGRDYVGGIVGYNKGEVTHCYTTGAVTGNSSVGGVVGYSEHGHVTHCHSTARVEGKGDSIGGLVGQNASGTVTRCYSTGAVSGRAQTGGLVGYNFGSLTDNRRDGCVTQCYSTGPVSGTSWVGGLIGDCNGRLVASYTTGRVTGTHSFVGGLVGENSRIVTHCYSTGAVAGADQSVGTGGLAGLNSGTVTQCYSTGAVNGGSCVGGLVGQGREGVWLCVWDTQTSGRSASVGGVGLTTDEMRNPQMLGLNGLANDPNWVLNAGMDYPRLAWEGRPGQTVQQPTVDWLPGQGTAEAPYLISTAGQLIRLGRAGILSDKHFVLSEDINLNPNLANGQLFAQAPIPAFMGVFDGNHHVISNLTIRGSSLLGLFGYLTAGARVRNLGTVNMDITSTGSYVGGLTGSNDGSIVQCYSTGSISGAMYVGGLVGENTGAVTGCYSTGTIKGPYNSGGLVGSNQGGTVTQCYSTGTLDDRWNAGGLVGYNTGVVRGCYSAGRVGGAGGGLVAEGSGPVVSPGPGIVLHSVWDVETSGLAGSVGGVGLTRKEMMDPHMLGLNGFANEPNWVLNASMDYPRLAWEGRPGQVIPEPVIDGFEGSGLEENPYRIGTAGQLILLGKSSILWDKHFVLSADINLDPNLPDGHAFAQAVIPAFKGVFDGNGHTISNLAIQGSSLLGLFGRLEPGAEIRNLGVADVRITGSSYIGGLVGYSDGGYVARCHSTGTVSGGEHTGGLVGYNGSSGTVACSYSTGAVSGTTVGGLAGFNYKGTLIQCYSGGMVSSLSYGGGLVGVNSWGCVIDCYSAGAVSSTGTAIGLGPYLGGLVGENFEGYVIGCYSTGPISGTQSAGGLVAYSWFGEVVTSFWDFQTSCQLTSAGGIAMPTARMQTAKTFLDAGWDFIGETANGAEDTWWIDEGKDYPHLWWEAQN